MRKIAKKLAIVVFVLAVLLVSSFLLNTRPVSVVFSDSSVIADRISIENNITLTLSFSKTDHFYTEGIAVEITASKPDARVFFTIDGSVPTVYSYEYLEPIYFELQPDLYTVVLRAIAVYGNITTDTLTHTYFIGEEIHERFGSDIMVFSLSTNPDYFFDCDIGILVPGRIQEEWRREYPDAEAHWSNPANFHMRGREWERPIHVETFTSYGEQVLSQAAGVRVHGNATRSLPQKSLRLIARREYSPEAGRFHYDFFPDETAIDGSPISRIDTLILRNGGNDHWRGMINNEAGSAIAREAGLRVVTPSRAAAVFLNGEYYGFMWLQVRINEQYLENTFNAPTRDFDIIGSGLQRLTSYYEHVIADLAIMNEFAYKDLRYDAIFAELEALVDIDDFLLYYAFQIIIDHWDWPGNNVRRWRYVGEQTPGLASELDGRWRYLVFDLDYTLGLRGDGRVFHRILDRDNPQSPLLVNILTRPDMADKFTMIFCDIMANVINGQTVSNTIDTLFNEDVWSEIAHWAVRWDRDAEVIEYHHRRMIDFATYRHEYIFESLSEYFGFGMEMYTVNVSGGEAIIGTQRGASSRYFNHLVVPVSPVVPEFHEFAYWVLNGEQIYEADITVSLADAYNAVVELELTTRPATPPLVISELYEIGARNSMTLVNLTDDEIHTSGLFLSNNSNNLQRWALPDMTVAPGETIELAGRSSRAAYQMFMVQKDFNVREGRKFYLSDIDGNIIDSFSLRGAERAVRDLETIG